MAVVQQKKNSVQKSQTAHSSTRRPSLDPKIIRDNALVLSAQRGLQNWSIRDLANHMEVAPSIVYHYYENKEALLDAVMNVICEKVQIPDMSLEWKNWFSTLFKSMANVFMEFPGAAEQLLSGRLVEGTFPFVDASVKKLDEAGFGENTAYACSMIYNLWLSTVSLRTQRREGSDNTLAADEMLQRLEGKAEQSEGVRRLLDGLILPQTREAESETVVNDYFAHVLAATFEGIDRTMRPNAEGVKQLSAS